MTHKNKLGLIGTLVCAVCSLASCGTTDTFDNTVSYTYQTESDIGDVSEVLQGKLDNYSDASPLKIALLIDVGGINDHSFNETIWKSIYAFTKTNGRAKVEESGDTINYGNIKAKYFSATSDTYPTSERKDKIFEAVTWGANLIVLGSSQFQSALARAIEEKITDNTYVLGVDLQKTDNDNSNASFEFGDNVTSLVYQEEEAGFLAGYATVKDGYRKLGFIGGVAVPSVNRYGSGFVQGADYAANELSLDDRAVKVNYYNAGSFEPTAQATKFCRYWYSQGYTEVIFACGGNVYKSVTEASVAFGNKPWIGADVNFHADTTLDGAEKGCITSAMKDLSKSVSLMLTRFVNNSSAWDEGIKGKVMTVGAKNGLIALPTPETTGDEGCWGFSAYTQEDYSKIYSKLKDGTVKVNANSDIKELGFHNFGCTQKTDITYLYED